MGAEPAMRTVALVTQKGGSGKSTLAACLAVAAQEAGERVFLIDMDPQKSLTKWAHRRADKTMPVEAVCAAKLPDAVAALAKGGVTLPTIFDIWSSEVTRGKLKTLAKDFAFVLNQCPAMQESQRVTDGAAALESMGGLLRPLVTSRVAYQEAAREGMGPTELEPEGKAADEMRVLWASLKKRLARPVAKSPRRVAIAA